MKHFLRSIMYFPFFLFFIHLSCRAIASCNSSCGSLPVNYPFGTGFGCGSPLFFPSVSCISDSQLVLNTHTGTYTITSISYSTSTLIISPSTMSTCINMLPSNPNFGLNWTGPFQLGPSIFVLLGCSPTASSSICDETQTHICESLNSCPGILSLGLPIFAPANSCCVYSPASLGPKSELDLSALNCAAYTSIMSYGDVPTDPLRWEYGVELKYGQTGFEDYGAGELCRGCEASGGVCGYTPPKNYYTCVCPNGGNSSVDCTGQDKGSGEYWVSLGILLPPSQGVLILISVVHLFMEVGGMIFRA